VTRRQPVPFRRKTAGHLSGRPRRNCLLTPVTSRRYLSIAGLTPYLLETTSTLRPERRIATRASRGRRRHPANQLACSSWLRSYELSNSIPSSLTSTRDGAWPAMMWASSCIKSLAGRPPECVGFRIIRSSESIERVIADQLSGSSLVRVFRQDGSTSGISSARITLTPRCSAKANGSRGSIAPTPNSFRCTEAIVSHQVLNPRSNTSLLSPLGVCECTLSSDDQLRQCMRRRGS